jgi:hypothetical protein
MRQFSQIWLLKYESEIEIHIIYTYIYIYWLHPLQLNKKQQVVSGGCPGLVSVLGSSIDFIKNSRCRVFEKIISYERTTRELPVLWRFFCHFSNKLRTNDGYIYIIVF